MTALKFDALQLTRAAGVAVMVSAAKRSAKRIPGSEIEMKSDDGFRASPHRFDARLDAFREQWPFAIVILGLILTVFWIMAVAWYPLHLIANGMWISFVDLLRSMS